MGHAYRISFPKGLGQKAGSFAVYDPKRRSLAGGSVVVWVRIVNNADPHHNGPTRQTSSFWVINSERTRFLTQAFRKRNAICVSHFEAVHLKRCTCARSEVALERYTRRSVPADFVARLTAVRLLAFGTTVIRPGGGSDSAPDTALVPG